MVEQDPYPLIGVADGIAFSCSNAKKLEDPLKHIFKELENTVYPDGYTWDPDLKRWSNQGVLMLNTALTCQIGKIGTHVELWKPFTTYLFEILSDNNTGLIYVFLGNKVKEWHRAVGPANYKFFTTHPISAVYKQSDMWESSDIFNNVNVIVKKTFKEEIKW